MARRGWVAAGLAVALVGAGVWTALAARPLPAGAVPAGWTPADADPERGAQLFALGGCASCHAAPGAEGEARQVLAGGRRFETEFGAFVAPNISPHAEAGVGGWTAADFASAMLRGVSPDGRHYYPAFPWPSYARMETAEVLDIWAHLLTLPADATPSQPHDLDFPWSIRAGIGAWKWLHLDPDPVVGGLSGPAERGRHLAEGAGHCAECHTPRDRLGGPDRSRWMAGAPNPDGPGRIPGLTPDRLGSWSEGEIAFYLSSGFTPDYDVAGGSMAAVIEGTSKLSDEDRRAIAAYLKALPAPAE